MKPSHIVFIENLLIKPTAITAVVWVSREHDSTASAPSGLANRLEQIMPSLVDHVCVGEDSKTFGEELASTKTAHLFEHMVLDLISYAEESVRSLAGHTSWDHTEKPVDEGSQDKADFVSYRVTVGTPDDFVGVGAFTIAQNVLDWAWSGNGDAAPEPYDLVDELLIKRARYA